MGLLFEEMQMIRELHKYLDKGGKDMDYINAKIAVLSQSDKRQKSVIQILNIMGKYKNGSSILKKLYATNLDPTVLKIVDFTIFLAILIDKFITPTSITFK